MAKTTIKEIVDLWYETQMGNMHKCMEKQHELADLMWSLHEEFYGEEKYNKLKNDPKISDKKMKDRYAADKNYREMTAEQKQ